MRSIFTRQRFLAPDDGLGSGVLDALEVGGDDQPDQNPTPGAEPPAGGQPAAEYTPEQIDELLRINQELQTRNQYLQELYFNSQSGVAQPQPTQPVAPVTPEKPKLDVPQFDLSSIPEEQRALAELMLKTVIPTVTQPLLEKISSLENRQVSKETNDKQMQMNQEVIACANKYPDFRSLVGQIHRLSQQPGYTELGPDALYHIVKGRMGASAPSPRRPAGPTKPSGLPTKPTGQPNTKPSEAGSYRDAYKQTLDTNPELRAALNNLGKLPT